jgi:hypothetical protein
MALVKCKECGENVSTKATNCPKCGAKAPKKTSPLTWAVLGLIVFGFYISNWQDPAPSSISAESENKSDMNNSGVESADKVEKRAPQPRWQSFESEDEMTSEKSAYAASPRSSSNRAMDFPYQGTESWLGFGCDSESEWVYLGFSEAPNLNDTDIQDGYNVINTRVKWDDSVVQETFTQKWSDPFLSFRKDDQAIRRIVGGNNVLVELDWHGQKQAVIFSFTLRDSSNAIAEARQKCSGF